MKRRTPAVAAAAARLPLPTALTRSKMPSSGNHCSGSPIPLKTSSQPSTAGGRDSISVTSPRTGSTPVGRTAAARSGSRTSART